MVGAMMTEGDLLAIKRVETEDAVYSYREAEAARRLAIKLASEARENLRHALGIPAWATTLTPAKDEAYRWGKRDVDTLERLSPSMRKKLRLLKGAVK